MNSPRLKYEGWLYGLAFLLALGLRLLQLGASPLTDSEATFALQAFKLAQGKETLLGPQPLYILFTSLLFGVIEATNFLARLLPALAGSALVFAPWFFRERFQPRTMLIAAFLLAIDPGLVALSRQAGGAMLAVTFILFALAMWMERRPVPLGIFAGLALLSGPSVWSGLLTLGLTLLLLRGMKAEQPASEATQPESESLQPENRQSFIVNRQWLISLAATLLLGGTLFFSAPTGLSAWLASLPAYLGGWTSDSLVTPLRTLVTFLVYEPLGIFLAIFTLVRGLRGRETNVIQPALWLGIALLLAVFYRQPAQLAWAIIPLLALAAQELSRASEIFEDERMEVGVVVLAVTILLTYIWFNIANIALNPYGQAPVTVPLLGPVENPRSIVLFGSLAIVTACLFLVAVGWSARTAWLGSVWSFSIFLIIYSLGSAWGASGLRTPEGVELWNPDPKPLQADLLLASVREVSEISTGDDRAQPVVIMGVDSPALEWLLRYRSVEVVTTLDPLVAPPLVITPLMNDLGLPSAYRGQDFIWRQGAVWGNLQSTDRLSWFVFRKVPLESETVILWARDDLFPDARENISTP